MTAAEVAQARADYYSSKLEHRTHSLNTYICASAFGRADLGKRYIDLVDMFGPNGQRADICADEGFGPGLHAIAGGLASGLAPWACLPSAPVAGEDGASGVELRLLHVQPTFAADGGGRYTCLERDVDPAAVAVYGSAEDAGQGGTNGPAATIGPAPATGSCAATGEALFLPETWTPGSDGLAYVTYSLREGDELGFTVGPEPYDGACPQSRTAVRLGSAAQPRNDATILASYRVAETP